MRTHSLAVPLAAALALATLAPQAALAGTPRLAVVGEKNGALLLVDLGSRRADGQAIAADTLIVFPPPPAGAEGPTPPDHGRATLDIDCKGRTIQLMRMIFMRADNTVMKDDPNKGAPQGPVDTADARLLTLVCGEAFPDPTKTFSSEAAALAGVRPAN